jgi:two-component system, LuxR family, sensor kinase FixL
MIEDGQTMDSTCLEEPQAVTPQSLSHLVEASADLIFIMDPQGNLVFANTSVQRRTGYAAAGIVGKNGLDLVQPESREVFLAALRSAASGQTVENIEWCARTKDGGCIDVLSHFSPMPDVEGHAAWIACTGRDVTLLMQTQKELRCSQERLKALSECAPDACYLTDLMGTFLLGNKAAEELCGYPRDELIGKSFLKLDLLPKRQLPRAAGYLARLAMGNPVGPVEFHLKRKDNTPVQIEVRAFLARIGGQNLVLGTARDISDRKKTEEALRESEEKFKIIFEEACEGIAYLDGGGCVLDVNKKALEILEQSREQVIGKNFMELGILDAADAPGMLGHFQQVLCGTLRSLGLSVVSKQGDQLYLECSASVVQTRGREPCVVVIIRDVTDGRKAQEQQAQFVQRLSQINQELRDFAHVVSHDLKAPLRAIRLLSDWLSADYQDKLDEQGKENLRLLGGRVDHMRNLIEGILQYSRAGRAEQRMTLVDLNSLLPEMIDSLAVPPHIAVQIQASLPALQADATRVTQVFQNLLSNAVKYMDKPEGRIRITCDDRGGFWEFRVIDNGPGIEEKYFERIFKIFQTLAPKDEYESTGVGLALVKKIVQLYGGKVWVESVVGQGSTFVFTWPKQAPAGSPPSPDVAEPEVPPSEMVNA